MTTMYGRVHGEDRAHGPYRQIRADKNTHALVDIDYAHHEVHSGNYYYVQYSVVSLGAMTTPDDMLTLNWITPADISVHLVFVVRGSADWRIRLIEAPTGGAASPTGNLNIYNKNRISTNTSSMTNIAGTPVAGVVSYDATLATGGVTLWDQYLEGSVFSDGIASGTREEFVLAYDTQYPLSVYGTDADPCSIYMHWYEHTIRE